MSRRQKLLWAAVIAYSLFHLGYSVVRYNIFTGTSSGDFNRVYQEATQWARCQTYMEGGVWHPPFYYWLLNKLDGLLGGQRPLILFLYFIQFPLFAAAIPLLVKAGNLSRAPPPAVYPLLAAALIINFQPMLETIAQHKVEGLEFVLLCAAVAAYRGKKDLLCGALVVLATNLKFLPGILILYFLVKREWKVAAGMGLAAAALLVLLLGSYGWETVYFALVKHPIDQLFFNRIEGAATVASVEMQTLTGTINRWMARPIEGTPFMRYIENGSYMPVPNPETARHIASACRLLLAVPWLFVIRQKVPPAEREARWLRLLLEISLSLVMILMLSQAARVHYGILLLPAFVWAAMVCLQRPDLFRGGGLALLAAAYSLSAFLVPGGFLNRLPPLPVWGHNWSALYLWISLPVFGYLLLGASLLICMRRLAQTNGRGR